ncbi:ATP-binding protein [Microbacterium paulum]|uniref:ATP-binding protein n=1 Tax=Microbacterium paulum TaxID=2707006 RepID=UPI001E301CD0|nr:ATP-binding protein [Microbacterium paulum]
MQIPTAAFAGHLTWTRTGTIWATWRLQGLPHGLGTDEMLQLVLSQHQALFQSLRGEALLLGYCAATDPVDIVDKMLAGVDIRDTPAWAEECALTLDSLEEIPLGERVYWLSIPLAAGNWRTRLRAAWRAGSDQFREQLALPRRVPTKGEVSAAMAAATQLEHRIPAGFQARPATVAEQVWIAMRSQHRGLVADGAAPDEVAGIDEVPATQLPTAMPRPWLDEGGQSDLSPSELKRFLPFNRRYLKVQSPHSELPSYQVMQAVVAGPKGGWLMPGVEWISRVEQYEIDVDWAIRLTVSPAEAVKRRNKRAEEQLIDQVQQQSGTNAITGSGSDLVEIGETLAAYHASLNVSDKEVEVEATVIFAVGGETADIAQARARYLAADFKASDFLLETPLGGQEELWWAMQPGTPTSRIVRDLAQITTGREFASGLPIVSCSLGDDRGIRLGDNITTGRHTPILIDLHGNIRADSSGSFGVVAELGAGKSVLLKAIAGDVLDRGGRIVAIDRTDSREYATFAQSLTGKQVRVVDILEPEWSLDPIRVLGPERGSRMVQSLFALMLNVDPVEPRGVELSRLLEAEYMAKNGIRSLGSLMTHLAELTDNTIATELLHLIRVVATKDFGAVLFDETIPALDLSADAIVFTTRGLPLPDRGEVEKEHLFKQLPLEKKFGRAMYAVLTQLTREACFMDIYQLALAVFDEAHHITASRDGEAELQTFFRDGRKHGAAAAVGSHDPADFGDEVTRGLIKIRFVMRQTDENLARRALEWLGLPVTVDTIREVTKNLSPMGAGREVAPERRGEGIMRDIRGRYGKFRKTLPARPERRKAVMSTPSAPVESR